MKKLLIILLFTLSVNGFAQITLENNYVNSNLRLVKLSSSGYKYVMNDTSVITLFNLNHTVFRTINIPPIGYHYTILIRYISEELFNTNPSDIEYLIISSPLPGHSFTHVFDEAGNTLFIQDSTAQSAAPLGYGNEDFISYTPSGFKMIMQNAYTGASSVYSLPGFLPCHDCTNGVITSMVPDNNNTKQANISNYPNPNKGETTIEYTLPQGTTTAEIIFYNITGQEVKRYKVTDAFHNILISTAELDAGTYYYQLQTSNGFSAGKKMIVIK